MIINTSVLVCPTDPHHFDNPVYAYPEKSRQDPLPLPPNIPVQKNDLGGATHPKQLAMDEEEGKAATGSVVDIHAFLFYCHT